MRRPELFAVAGSRVDGGRAAVVERLSKGLKAKCATVPVVRALFQMVKGLPEFAWRTRHLPKTTIALRDAFENAKSPERFLFVEVPEALGLATFSQKKPKESHVSALFNALNSNLQQWAKVAPEAKNKAMGALLDACGLEQGEAGWHELRQQCLQIEPAVTEPQLLAFVRRVVQTDPDANGIDSVLALVANRPPDSWSDADVDRFSDVAKAVGQAFRDATRLADGPSQGAGRIAALAPQERKQARKLLKDLRKHIAEKARDQSPTIIRAAIGELARGFEKQGKE